jgi:hypothetical protein
LHIAPVLHLHINCDRCLYVVYLIIWMRCDNESITIFDDHTTLDERSLLATISVLVVMCKQKKRGEAAWKKDGKIRLVQTRKPSRCLFPRHRKSRKTFVPTPRSAYINILIPSKKLRRMEKYLQFSAILIPRTCTATLIPFTDLGLSRPRLFVSQNEVVCREWRRRRDL